jgi:ABC-type multidrug transport system fused ATPase/permease subunit
MPRALARGTPHVTAVQIKTWPLFRRLIIDCLQFKTRLAAAVISAAALGLAQLYFTWLVRRWVEGPVMTGDPDALAAIIVEGGAVTAVAIAAMTASRYAISAVNLKLVAGLRKRAIDRLLALDMTSIRQRQVGEIVARFINDAWQLSGFLEMVVRRSIREGTVGIGALVMLFVLNWRLALIACTLVPLTALLLVKIGGVIRRWRLLAHAEVGALGTTLVEQLQGISTIKTYLAEDGERRRFADQQTRLTARILRGELWAAALISSVFLATAAGVLAIVWYGTAQLATGGMSQASLLAFVLYAGQTVEPLRRLSEVHGFMQTVVAAASRVYELIDLEKVERRAGRDLTRASGVVTVEAVTFAYRPDQTVLRGLDLHIGARERIAIVGATGSGKSTLAALLMRFYGPQRGRILLDGVDIAALSLDSLRRHVCVVEQEPFIFAGRLCDNIRYGSPHAGIEDVARASSAAGLDPVIDRLPDGLGAAIGEGGKQLSGGEKQRIALARAIVRNPAVLVLDEATSALDGETEADVFDRLDAWLSQRTVIAIGHRFSTIRRFPRVVVLANGRIAADGAADVLLAESVMFVGLFGDQLTAAAPASNLARP